MANHGNRGRSTTNEPDVPYYPDTPIREMAKHLRLTLTRYLAGNEPLAGVQRAIEEFQVIAARPAPVSGKADHFDCEEDGQCCGPNCTVQPRAARPAPSKEQP